MTVQIIIPCYHSEKYLQRCIDSILTQTYEDWKATFIVDDYQHDKTLDIIHDNYDNRFLTIANDFKTNPATARNIGFSWLRGEYTCFLDSDDWMEPTRLEKQVRFIKDLDWISSQVYHELPNETRIINIHPGSVPDPSGVTSILFNTNYLCTIIDTYGYLFDPSLGSYDDWDLVMRIRDGRSAMIPEPLVHLFENPDGLSRSETPLAGAWKLYKIIIRRWQYDLLPVWTWRMIQTMNLHYVKGYDTE